MHQRALFGAEMFNAFSKVRDLIICHVKTLTNLLSYSRICRQSNTEIRNDQDDRENKRMQPTKTGDNEGPKENKDDTEGLRSESGGKSLGKESGNKERG